MIWYECLWMFIRHFFFWLRWVCVCCVIVCACRCCVIVSYVKSIISVTFFRYMSVSVAFQTFWFFCTVFLYANHKLTWLLVFVQDYRWQVLLFAPWHFLLVAHQAVSVCVCNCGASVSRVIHSIVGALTVSNAVEVGCLLFRHRSMRNCAGGNPTPSSGVLQYANSKR